MDEQSEKASVYRIRVQGMVDQSWSDWFENMAIAPERESDDASITTLTGAVADQAALRGILLKIWDLNLTVISVARVETDAEHGGGKANE